MMKKNKLKRAIHTTAFIAFITVALLILSTCYVPLAQDDGALALNIKMSRNGAGGDTRVLAGLLINAEYEEALKDITQLLAVLTLDSIPAGVEDKATELLLDLALAGTIKFGGTPFFAIEVPYNSSDNTADFNISGVPSKRDYFLYMGGFDDKEQVKMYFGLMEEDADFKDEKATIPFSNLFYVEGEDGETTITVPFSVSGLVNPIPDSGEFIVTKDGNYQDPGWYYLTYWDSGGASPDLNATIIAPASQPFRVETGKKSSVEVHLVSAPPE